MPQSHDPTAAVAGQFNESITTGSASDPSSAHIAQIDTPTAQSDTPDKPTAQIDTSNEPTAVNESGETPPPKIKHFWPSVRRLLMCLIP